MPIYPSFLRTYRKNIGFAQHMDYLPVGRGLGSVSEAVKAAGAVGVMLNHAESL